jgi:hypothetical protein
VELSISAIVGNHVPLGGGDLTSISCIDATHCLAVGFVDSGWPNHITSPAFVAGSPLAWSSVNGDGNSQFLG